ncbi:hypothetical protein SELMODRAFT_82308 [Selaginella moellendorffii]|uniref:Erythronate-4-phosphate dehydrogenase family protein n=1 Tax=Selaginella moellendorffii TaxID=88036 RepID=D8R0R0_SELML|nr:hypothetical protein SELMODRAFT_82308 [Selaginella moellendorffii]
MEGGSYFGGGGSLEVKVLYVRVSYCPLDGNPDSLVVRFPSRTIDKYLEVNGARIPPSEEISLALRRDRMDTESVEVTYVGTDHLHVVGSVGFEVVDKEEVLLSGVLQKVEKKSSSTNKAGSVVWNMECNCALGSAGCVFTRGRHEYFLTPPTMEICVVGSHSGSPIILTRTVHLMARRRVTRCGMLDAIPEDEECHRSQNRAATDSEVGRPDFSSLSILKVDASDTIQASNENQELGLSKFFLPEATGYGENEDGEMSWFNAGVRVGVGIGLGMCLGVGIGVGLMVRTYQATTRSFRRRLF